LTVLGFNQNPIRTAIAFIIFNITNSLIWYCLDIFIEHFSSVKKTGSIRGFYLSLTSFAWLFAPIFAGIIVSKFGFTSLYTIVSLCIVCVGIVLHFSLRTYHDNKYRKLSTFAAVRALIRRPNLLRITIINFILQFFYAWMVVYTPLYLHEMHGIPFTTIGIMFTIMLLPFVLLQYPIGRLLDTIHHEREFLTVGILIIAGSTFMFGYSLFNGNIIMLTLMLFTTRCGASIVEVVSESYFFKSVTAADAEIISLFRSTLPIAYLFAPLAATVILWNVPYNVLFLILGGIVLLAIFPLDRLANLRNS
jgi:MFS family permease